jgi:pimeloyl-ACP methyl ester carboxylesterase
MNWGSPVAWHCALLRPDLFPAVAAMSVPHRRRGAMPPLEVLRKAGKADYYYLYFQEQAAEDEFARDARYTIARVLYIGSGETPRGDKMSMYVDRARGFLGAARGAAPRPPWLSDADLDVFAADNRRTGFRGGLNWYRNIDRNWELTAPWQDAKIMQPALFIAGSNDAVITGAMGRRALDELESVVPHLERKIILEGAGHWIQQERAAEVNAALISFARRHLAYDQRIPDAGAHKNWRKHPCPSPRPRDNVRLHYEEQAPARRLVFVHEFAATGAPGSRRCATSRALSLRDLLVPRLSPVRRAARSSLLLLRSISATT